jgi:hypothetical protein
MGSGDRPSALKLAGVALLVLAAVAAGRRAPRAFHFEPDAVTELRRLWSASLAAKAEQVACLAGEALSDTVRVTRILPLAGGADSMGVAARSSLDACAPPIWQGTVHTHVALRDGQRPYSVLSGADRGVNTIWWRRWETDGVFCVVFSSQDAYCELDGPSGVTIFPHAIY